jgi:hypothetical protein
MKDAAQILLELGDRTTAVDAVNAANKAIDRLYEEDANPDDPNQFSKFFWPSTHAWRDLVEVAAKVSPATGTEIVNDIPDSEIKALERVVLADCWLKVPLWRATSPMVWHKKKA